MVPLTEHKFVSGHLKMFRVFINMVTRKPDTRDDKAFKVNKETINYINLLNILLLKGQR